MSIKKWIGRHVMKLSGTTEEEELEKLKQTHENVERRKHVRIKANMDANISLPEDFVDAFNLKTDEEKSEDGG